MLEWTGGSQVYAFSGYAFMKKAFNQHNRHFLGFTPADSRDEAFGIAMRVMLAYYPVNDGWMGHGVQLRQINDVTINRINFASIKPVQVGDD